MKFLLVSLFTIVQLGVASGLAGATSVYDIPKFEKVSATFFRGAHPLPAEVTALKRIGVRTIINLQGGDLAHTNYPNALLLWEPGEDPAMIEEEKVHSEKLELNFYNFPWTACRQSLAKKMRTSMRHSPSPAIQINSRCMCTANTARTAQA